MQKENFDSEYKKEKCYWSMHPSPIILKILEYKKSGDVLDIGVGEGRNALFLAKNKFNVEGIDISKEGIKKFLTLANELGVAVRGEVADILDYTFKKKFDIVISISTLHFLKKEYISHIIKKIKENTKEKGLNIITVFTEENPTKDFPYLFKKNELYSFYKDWDIIFYKEFITPIEQHGDEKPHRHAVATIIAQKVHKTQSLQL